VTKETELTRIERELKALIAVAKALTSPHTLRKLLRDVMYSFSSMLESVDAGAVMLWDESLALFKAEAVFGYDSEIMAEIALVEGESITGKVYDACEACLMETPEAVEEAVSNMSSKNREIMESALGTTKLPRSAVAAPIRIGERKLGVLVLESLQGPVDFQVVDLPFVQTLADLIGLAIRRAGLEEQADAERDAQQANRVRSEVMATLSHELRTPLAAIKGYSSALLLDEIDWPDEKRNEFLQMIDGECDNLQTMIGDILDSSLIDVGQFVIEQQPVRLSMLAKEIADDIQLRTEKHLIIVDFPDDFPIIDADPRRVTQVMRNILDNAIKYSPEGGLIIIHGELRPQDIVISISDQGVGISPEDLIPLFEKYFRVKASTGYHVAGTGLGLPVARAIVEAHGGRIWADSEVGQGTILSFSIPCKGLSAETDE
jgi:signal transduction histidine kinase